jgi:hypothetical protein
MSDPRGYLPGKMSVGEAQAARFKDLDGTDGPFIEPSIGREKELQSILDGIQSPPPDVDTPSNGVSLLDGPDKGAWSKIRELATNILDYMPSVMSEAEAHDSKDPVNTEVHSLYDAISNAELRSDEHRKDRWIKSDTSSAWGPVQIMPDTMEDARRVGSLSGGIPLSAEEDTYVGDFLKGVRSTSAKDKKLYISIAKKLMHYYNNKYKDPLKIANVWRWGERGAAATDTTWDGNPGLGRDISSPKGSPGSDLPYWEEFKTIMGL